MKLVRSDTPGVVRNIASAGAWASRDWATVGFACAANVLATLDLPHREPQCFGVRSGWPSAPVSSIEWICPLARKGLPPAVGHSG